MRNIFYYTHRNNVHALKINNWVHKMLLRMTKIIKYTHILAVHIPNNNS